MAITSVHVMNVLGFHRQWVKTDMDDLDFPNPSEEIIAAKFHLDDAFCINFTDKINVLIGENGVGKSTILKMIYAATQNSNPKTRNTLDKFFLSAAGQQSVFVNDKYSDGQIYFRVSSGETYFMEHFTPNTDGLDSIKIQNSHGWDGENIQSVYIPTTEMLSHSKGFLALDQRFNIPFDKTQVDIVANASLPEARALSKNMLQVCDKISSAIDGTVVQENDTFYVQRKNGCRIEFSLEAEGLRKLGLLWKRVRNGLLEPGSILLWDEPEANLNPELFSLVADILLELQRNGVQIFVSTHSFNFAMYLEIRRSEQNEVLFHNLYLNDGEIVSQTACRMDKLSPNHIMIADEKLLDEVYDA